MDKRTLLIYTIFILALCGLGSAVFYLLYTGVSYTMPVTDSQRFRFAFWDTVVIMTVIIGVMFWKDIRAFMDKVTPIEDDDEAE
jgi:hypothetical protein